MSTHTVPALREQFAIGHVTFELSETTFALIAGEAVFAKDRRPLFTGMIHDGLADQLRVLADAVELREPLEVL